MSVQGITLVNCCLPPSDPRQLAPPQGLLAVAAALRRHGYHPTLVNAAASIRSDEWSTEALATLLARTGGGVVGLSVWDSVLPFALGAVRLAKAKAGDLAVVLGGPAASTLGRELIGRFPWIDGLVMGEGETGLPSLLALWEGRVADPAQLPEGVFVRIRDEVWEGSRPRALLSGDAIPAPDYDFLDGAPYGRAEICSARGCSHGCRFCSVHSVWGRGVRLRPLSGVIAELELLRALARVPTRQVHVLDDSFLTSWQRARTFCESVRTLPAGQGFTCYARAEDLEPERLRYLARSGCQGLFVGLEAPRIRGEHRPPTADDLDRVVGAASHMFVIASLIWGDPKETWTDVTALVDSVERLLRSSPRIAVNVYQLAPLSGTYYARRHVKVVFRPEWVSEFVYPRYLPGLEHDVEAAELIRQHPRMFTAFYPVDTEDFERKRAFVDAQVARLARETEVPS